MTKEENGVPPDQWIEAFVEHVTREVPQAPRDLLLAKATELQALLGQFDPVDVAEAEWNALPLGGGVPGSPD